MNLVWHNIYSMTIDRYSLMTISKDTKLLSRSGLIKPSEERYKEFLDLINSTFDKDGSAKALDLYYKKVVVYTRITLLQTLYYGLLLSDNPKFIEYYKKLYNKEPETAKDYNKILKEISKLESNLRLLNIDKDKDKDNKEESTFEDIISSVEIILGYNLDRNLKLYQFKYSYDLAIKKSKLNGKA